MYVLNHFPDDIQIEPPTHEQKKAWEKGIIERCRNQCSNCGASGKLKVHMIVPFESGGRYVDSNGVLLCRACDMGRDYSARTQVERAPVNFWVSRSFYERIQRMIGPDQKFKSMSALIRYLMLKYVSCEDSFDDIENYQDSGNDVKINAWVDRPIYLTFQSLLKRRGRPVSYILKALVKFYDESYLHSWKREPPPETTSSESIPSDPLPESIPEAGREPISASEPSSAPSGDTP